MTAISSDADAALLPRIFQIETILGCNLKCPDCAVGGGIIPRRKGRWTFDKFKVIADKIEPYCEYLYLHIWGEPLLNTDIVEIIAYASRFTATNISTNGNNMTPMLAKQLILSGLTDCIVSIDGVSQEVYGKYRINGKVEKALNALRLLQTWNQQFGCPVNVIPQFIVFEHNRHEMEAFATLCAEIGLRPVFKAPYFRADSDFAPTDIAAFVRQKQSDPEHRRANMSACGNGRDVFTVLLDGQVVACCHDHAGHSNFGNLFDQDLLEVWQSETYSRFRSDLRGGRAWDYCLDTCLSF